MLRKKMMWMFAFLMAILASGGIGAQEIHPGKKGPELIRLLKQDFRPERTLSYRGARQQMFSNVDNQDGVVRLVYTGKTIRTNSIPNHTFVNTEHLWPQSRFGSSQRGAKKADLYHLRPTFNRVNGERDNKPFADIKDEETDKWWNDRRFVRDIPSENIEEFSESTDDKFEPREDFKGDAARSMFYFAAIYSGTGLDEGFFAKQKETLLKWHLQDPVDSIELLRNDSIERIQGNRNPFVDDPTLVFRAFAPGSAQPGPGLESRPFVVSDRLENGDQIDICTWNLEWFFDADIGDNTSDLSKEMSASDDEEFEKRLEFFSTTIKKLGLPEVIALQEVENRKVVERLAKELKDRHGGNYKVAFVQGKDTFTEQDVAFLYEDKGLDVEAKRMTGNFRNRNLYKVPSKHCVLTVSKRTASGVTKKLSIITCHLIAGGRSGSKLAKRKKQARVINHFAREMMTNDPERGVIVLGDMNAAFKMDDMSRRDAMGVLAGLETLDPEDDFLDLNSELEEKDRATHVSKRELDRIFINGALLDDVGLVFEQITVRRDLIKGGQSDHFPMVATFTYIEE